MSNSPERPKLAISSAEDLIEALRHPDPRARYAVLATMAQRPELARRYRETLLEHLPSILEANDETVVCAAVCVMIEISDRTTLWQLFQRELPPMALRAVGHRLANESWNWLQPFWEKAWLERPTGQRKTLLADMAVGHRSEVEVVVASSKPCPLIALTENNMPEWLEALRGPHRQVAQALLQEQGDLSLLTESWDELDDATRLWLRPFTADPLPQMDPMEGLTHPDWRVRASSLEKVLSQPVDPAVIESWKASNNPFLLVAAERATGQAKEPRTGTAFRQDS